MYRKLEDFKKDWEFETAATIKVFEALTDESLKLKVADNVRALGFLAWHIVVTLSEMGSEMGLVVNAPSQMLPQPATAKEIVDSYRSGAAAFIDTVLGNWNDDMLDDDIPMYGQTWKRGDALSAMAMHQVHHRGQMTVIMRQAGLRVPGTYGPAREDWASMGMAEMP